MSASPEPGIDPNSRYSLVKQHPLFESQVRRKRKKMMNENLKKKKKKLK